MAIIAKEKEPKLSQKMQDIINRSHQDGGGDCYDDNERYKYKIMKMLTENQDILWTLHNAELEKTCAYLDENNEISIRRKVGMVFQNPDNQIVATIVEDDVAFGPENLGIPREDIRKRVDEALKLVDMYDYRKHEPHRLSGGQKQRVAIAGVIAMQTNCIVLDEPTAMLDPKGRREVMNALLKLKNELGISVILVTHFMDEAVKADRVVVMNDGKVGLDGTPAEVFSHMELLKSIGLAVPKPMELAVSLKESGIDLNAIPLTTADFVENFKEYINNRG